MYPPYFQYSLAIIHVGVTLRNVAVFESSLYCFLIYVINLIKTHWFNNLLVCLHWLFISPLSEEVSYVYSYLSRKNVV